MTDWKRAEQVANCFGQGINPEEAIDDYGFERQDYNQRELDEAQAQFRDELQAAMRVTGRSADGDCEDEDDQ